MKLFKKSTLSIELANQKRNQIEEGISLAKRVDALRETLVDLKRQEDEHIKGMKERIDRETHDAEFRLRVLESEIAELLMRKDDLKEKQKFLDEMDQSKAVIQKGLDRIREKEEKIELMRKDEKDRLTRIKIREKELNSALSRTDYKD